jgi:hypothetical protein
MMSNRLNLSAASIVFAFRFFERRFLRPSTSTRVPPHSLPAFFFFAADSFAAALLVAAAAVFFVGGVFTAAALAAPTFADDPFFPFGVSFFLAFSSSSLSLLSSLFIFF